MNIFCVKIGKKYDYTWVNRLYKMCRKNITKPFNFFCYTDDKSNIDPNINILNYLDHNLDVIVYNKLFLLSSDMSRVIDDEPRLYFDLDIVIKHNIDKLLEFKSNTLAVIKCVWKDTHFNNMGYPNFDHDINSSCMMWEKGKAEHIWDHFYRDPEFFMMKYKNGMDPYLYYEHKQRGDLPKVFFHSYLYGADLEKTEWARDKNGDIQAHLIEHIVEPIPITLFNSGYEYIHRYAKYYED
jgi:hypothetical protein